MAVSYVKFQRGSQAAYDKLVTEKRVDDNTLYFIYPEGNSTVGKLYLGARLISGGDVVLSAASLNDLADVITAEVKVSDFLVAEKVTDAEGKETVAWVNKGIEDVAALIKAAMGEIAAPAQIFQAERTPDHASDEAAIAEQVGDKTLTAGDMAIVKTPIAGGKYQHTAYVHNGEMWVAMDGNYDAKNVLIGSKITLAGNYGTYTDSRKDTVTVNQIGNKKIGDEFAAGTSLHSILMDILSQRLQPSKTAPTATISASGSENSKEVGESYTLPTATLTVTSGSYTYDGTDTGVKYLADNVTIAYGADPDTATYSKVNSAEMVNGNTISIAPADYSAGATTALFTDSAVSYTFSGKAHNEAGNVAVDNLGDPSNPEVKIAAGDLTVDDKTVKFYGYRRMFMGTVDSTKSSATIDSKLIRTDMNKLVNEKVSTSAKEFTVPTGATKIIVACPKGYVISKCEYFTMSWEEIALFPELSDMVPVADYRGNDAEGNPINPKDYHVYVFTHASPSGFEADTKYRVTLKTKSE